MDSASVSASSKPGAIEADVPAMAGECDGDRVHRAFGDHRRRAGGKEVIYGAEELGAFVEERGVGGVEVLRSAAFLVGIGVSPGGEPEHLPVATDREDEPVAEPVDEPSGAGGAGQSGGEEFLVGDP